MKTDIVIPIHNAIDHLRVCLDAVARTTEDFRFILVDDCSGPEMRTYLQEVQAWRTDTIVVTSAKQRWFTRSSNLGLRMVKTPWAVLLNSDTIPRSGWLQELYDVRDLAAKDTGQKVAFVGSDLARGHPVRWENVRNPAYVTGHCWLLNMEAAFDASARRGTPGWYFNELSQEEIHIASDRLLGWYFESLGYATVRSYWAEVDHSGGASWRKPDGYHDLGRVSQLKLQDVD